MSYLLSIIVPTKDRYEYLKPLIELIKSFNSDEIELVIQDNTKNNSEILKFIQSLSFVHLKYFHTTEQISVAYNSDLAILNSTGKYVCFIGDDDGVSQHIISAVHFMEEKNIDVLKTAICSYKWPSYNFSRIANFSGVLMMSIYDKKLRKLNPKQELIRTLREGGNEVAFLPKVYHNIAARSTLDKIYDIGNTYFPGPSPDMANAVAMSFVTTNFCFLDFPVVIPGNSIRTGGDAQKYKGQCAPINEIPFLPTNTERDWEYFIPKVWSSETILPESACKALKYMGEERFIEEYLDKEKLLARFITGHSELRKLAFPLTANSVEVNLYYYKLFFRKIIKAVFNKISFTLFSVFYQDYNLSGNIFTRRNYFKIKGGLLSIREANNHIMKVEPKFKTY